jgi:hypothetical protein
MTRLRPNHPLPWNNIAWVLATSSDESIRNPQKAVELAERLCESTGYREPSAMDTLAVAYAAAGEVDRATAMAERAIERFQELNQPAMAAAVRRRLAELRASRRRPLPSPAATKQ